MFLALAPLVLGASNLLGDLSWEKAGAGEVAPGCVVVRSGAFVQWVPIMREDGRLALSGVLELRALEGGGSAYAAVHEYTRELVEVGTPQAVSRTAPGTTALALALQPREETAFLAVRVGFHQGHGELAVRSLALSGAIERAGAHDVLIWDEPALPRPALDAQWAETQLRAAGLRVARMPADAFGAALRRNAASIVVLPYGERFPRELLWPMVCFLARGGSFVSLGGYAFRSPLAYAGGAWIPAASIPAGTRPNLVPDGGFERSAEAPLGGLVVDGAWRRTSSTAAISAREPYAGAACATVSALDESGPEGGAWYLDLPSRGGKTYLVAARFKSGKIRGEGYGFFAFYQFAGERLATFRDIVIARDETPWREVRAKFETPGGVDRVRITFGVYRGFGEIACDEVELRDLTDIEPICITTERGRPGDGLETPPWRVGVFDADFPLARVAGVRPSAAQCLLRAPAREGALEGWSANAVVRPGKSRWVPLLECVDKFGEVRGAAGGLIVNYAGLYARSLWAFFGVENDALFGPGQPGSGEDFARLVRAMRRGAFLAECLPAEPVIDAAAAATLKIAVVSRDNVRGKLVVGLPEGERVIEQEWKAAAIGACELRAAPSAPGLARARVELWIDGEPVDRAQTGWYAHGGARGPCSPLLFERNYFTLGGRPVFLFGADNYGNDFDAHTGGPLLWERLFDVSRDLGLQIYEILLPGNFDSAPGVLAQVRAQGEMLAARGLVYMPGFLIGHNAAVNEARMRAEEAAVKAGVAALADLPRAIWYLNGDFQWQENDQAFLTEKWRAFAKDPQASFPPATGVAWDDAAAAALARFKLELCEAWCGRHTAAVRSVEALRPITSEYYQIPLGPLDQRLTIDGHTCANIGFFDLPGKDIENLPRCLAANDLRSAGKGVGLGEYGAKTHPAWIPESGDYQYHTARTPAQKEQLFAAVFAYTLGMGGSRVQTWCLRDAEDRVFPWGLVREGQQVPRDEALLHRNFSLVMRAIAPVDAPARVALVSPTLLRVGNRSHQGLGALYAAADALLALHIPFTVIDDFRLRDAALPYEALVYPAALALAEEDCASLLAWVEAGGKLVFSGDFGRDAARRPAATNRVAKFLGHEGRVAALPGEVAFEPAEALAGAIAAALARLEMRDAALPFDIDARGVHAFSVATRTGALAVFCPFGAGAPWRASLPHDLALAASSAWPVYVHDRAGEVALYLGDGALARRGEAFVRTEGLAALLALDSQDLAASAAVAILPWRARTVALATRRAWQAPSLLGGLLKNGRFELKTVRRIDPTAPIAFDPTDLPLVFLLCEEAGKDKWCAALTTLFYEAETVPGL